MNFGIPEAFTYLEPILFGVAVVSAFFLGMLVRGFRG